MLSHRFVMILFLVIILLHATNIYYNRKNKLLIPFCNLVTNFHILWHLATRSLYSTIFFKINGLRFCIEIGHEILIFLCLNSPPSTCFGYCWRLSPVPCISEANSTPLPYNPTPCLMSFNMMIYRPAPCHKGPFILFLKKINFLFHRSNTFYLLFLIFFIISVQKHEMQRLEYKGLLNIQISLALDIALVIILLLWDAGEVAESSTCGSASSRKRETLGLPLTFETDKLIPSDKLPRTRPHLMFLFM